MIASFFSRLHAVFFWGAAAFFGFPSVGSADLRDEIQTLYSERFQISPQGIPIVSVGIMENQKSVRLSCPHGCLAYLSSRSQPTQTLRIPPSTPVEIQHRQGRPAKLRYGLIAFHRPFSQASEAEALRKVWLQKGYPTEIWTTGSFFALQGRLFDNRRIVGIIGVFSSREEATRKAHAWSQKEGKAIRLHEEIDTMPQMSYALLQGRQRWEGSDLLRLVPPAGKAVRLEDVEYGRGFSWYRIQAQNHRGEILLAPDRKGEIAVINRLSLPLFLEGLLRTEMPPKAPLEALKAQAVCARNEILAKIGTRHRADPYLFCAHTHCQVYAGATPPTPTILKAIRQTSGEVLLSPEGQIADAPFSAICGGHTEDNEHVWSQAPSSILRGKADLFEPFLSISRGISSPALSPWLTSSPPAFCRDALPSARPKFRWQRRFPATILDAMIQAHHPIGSIKSIEIQKRGASGRVIALQIHGSLRSVSIHGELTIRRLFGGLYSSMFLVQARLASSGRPLEWIFVGGGWGHGVGLCQYGAIGRARAGFSYRQILQHYFSESRLSKIYGSSP